MPADRLRCSAKRATLSIIVAIGSHGCNRSLHGNALSSDPGRHDAGADSSADDRGDDPADANPNPATDGAPANHDRGGQRCRLCLQPNDSDYSVRHPSHLYQSRWGDPHVHR